MSDIVDAIDALVDEQLAAGPVDDYNADRYDRCPHCDRHWHGLPLTDRVARMYGLGVYDRTYNADEDDSPIVCHGSNFIGPMPDRRRTGIQAVTIGLADRAIQYASETIASVCGIPLADIPVRETPTQIQVWDRNFNLQHAAVPVTEWEWSVGHTRARFILDDGPPTSSAAEMLSTTITTYNPRQVWRVQSITTHVNGHCVVELRDVAAEMAEIEHYMPRYLMSEPSSD